MGKSQDHLLLAVISPLLLIAIGCHDDHSNRLVDPPAASTAISEIDIRQNPFYYYEGEPVFLNLDHRRLIIATDLSNPSELLRELLSDFPISLEGNRFSNLDDHWLYTLTGTYSPTELVNAIDRVRNDDRLRFASFAYTTEDGQEDVLLLNRIIVKFKSGISETEIDRLLSDFALTVERYPVSEYGFGYYILRYPPSAEPLEIAALIAEDSIVEWTDPNKVTTRQLATDAPTDPYYGSQFYLKNSITRFGIPVDINVESAWDITTGWGLVTVAVVDDGLDRNHVDFGDVNLGYDAFDGDCAVDCATNPFGDDSHGTHVAGIIAAQHQGIGSVGIAPGIYLAPIRIFRNFVAADDAAIADGINYAWYFLDADVLSNSWGGGAPSNAITDAINGAATDGRGGLGAIVVFAAGNTSNRDAGVVGDVLYPATLDNVIAVGAINRDGHLTNYSPEGPELDLTAPSGHYTNLCTGEVVTLDLIGSDGCNDGPGGDIDYTSTFSGTSAAAPQISGAAALLLSVDAFTRSEVLQRLYNYADDWGSSTQYGNGKINIHRSLDPPPPPDVSIDGPSMVQANSLCTWWANVSGSGPFTYSWYRNGSWTGENGSEYTADTGTSDFTLSVVVKDTYNQTSSTEVDVTISSSAPMCFT